MNVCCPVEIRQELSMLPPPPPSNALSLCFSLLSLFFPYASLSVCCIFSPLINLFRNVCSSLSSFVSYPRLMLFLCLSFFVCLLWQQGCHPTYPFGSLEQLPHALWYLRSLGVCVCACVHYTAVYEQNGHFDVRRLFKTKEIILQSS